MNVKVFDWYSHTNKLMFYFLEAKWEEIQPREGSLEKKKGTESTCNDLRPSKVVLAAELRY